jgi:hypothetical protein
MYKVRDWDQFLFSAGRNPVFPASFVEEAIFSSMHILGTFVENQMSIVVWVCVRVVYSISLLFMFLFVPIPCWLLWLCSTV